MIASPLLSTDLSSDEQHCGDTTMI